MTEQEKARAASPDYRARLEREEERLVDRRARALTRGDFEAVESITRRLAEIDTQIDRAKGAAA